ncbi:MAG: HAD family hydrolase [Deltaproteobacteria bacterium]|nr:HAD family hydrolase [Deltaproteobacteria bacterium]MBT4638129.1 HAD family hydrolase [Deltaproteobacteria bacterium]MBT6502410.1 HAD family hydrolase [Deltaproteobacteria bacterium]MBT6613379.1 HAD family hydrolase [Deltaproteobacteria bacterium]MBT7156045.1 HAD family hydrolase [Deltaproteobacteria bacterium]
MKNKRLYITDLDGTLLQRDGTLSEFSKSALTEMLSHKLPFTVASARSIASMKPILEGLTFHLPVISFNGGFISDLATGRHHFTNQLSPKVSEDLLGLIAESDSEPFISTFNGEKECLYYKQIINAGMQWYFDDRRLHKDKRLHYLHDLRTSMSDQVICFTVIGKEKSLSELKAKIEKRHAGEIITQFYENQYSRGWNWLSIHDYKATKGNAIRTLTQNWGHAETELVVFGDADNDIQMFQEADRSIAVANAEDSLKKHATEVIGLNSDDSVVKYIGNEIGFQFRNQQN